MRAKIIFLIIALMVISIVLVQSQSEGGLDYTVIYNCDDAGYGLCEYVISPVYKFDDIPTGGAYMEFPEDPISKQLVGCSDETAVFLGKYPRKTINGLR